MYPYHLSTPPADTRVQNSRCPRRPHSPSGVEVRAPRTRGHQFPRYAREEASISASGSHFSPSFVEVRRFHRPGLAPVARSRSLHDCFRQAVGGHRKVAEPGLSLPSADRCSQSNETIATLALVRPRTILSTGRCPLRAETDPTRASLAQMDFLDRRGSRHRYSAVEDLAMAYVSREHGDQAALEFGPLPSGNCADLYLPRGAAKSRTCSARRIAGYKSAEGIIMTISRRVGT